MYFSTAASTISSIIVASETRLTEKRHTSRTEPVYGKRNILDESLHSPQSFLYYVQITQKHALCLHPVKLFLNFGYSAAL